MATKTKTEKARFTYSETLNRVTGLTYVDRDFISERVGTNLKDWKRKIREGGPCTTGMSGFAHKGASHPGTVKIYYGVGASPTWPEGKAEAVYAGQFMIPAIFGTGSVGVAQAENQAIVRAHKDIKSNYTQFAGQTFLGELRETIGMLRKPAQAMRKGLGTYLEGLEKLRSPRTRTARQRNALKDAVAGSWLEVQYGLKPLINDVKGIAEQIARQVQDFKPRNTARGYGSYEANLLSDVTPFSVGSYGRGIQTRCRNHKTEVRFKVGLIATVQAPFGSIDRFAQENGLYFNEFVPTLWELMPYSFVADYFGNIGDILSCACSSSAGVAWINKTVRYTTTEVVTSQIDLAATRQAVGPNFSGAVGSFGRSFSSSSEVHRSGPSTIGVPSFQLSLPGDTSLAWINMAALLAQGASLSANFRR